MTIQNQNAKNVYTGNGSTTLFPYTFAMNDDHPEYIHVYITGEDGIARETEDFAVDVNASNVVYPKPGSSAAALAAGEKLTVVREVPLRQLLSLVNQGPFFAENIERQLDDMEMQIQQLREAAERSLKTSIESTNFNAAIPLKPGKSFRINQEGTGFEVTEDPVVAMQVAQISATLATAAKQAAEAAQAEAAQSAAIAITAAIKQYDSVIALKADMHLHAGMKAITSGYYAANDGGGGTYIVRAKAIEDVEDNGSIHFLQNGLVAELIIENDTVNVKQFGAKGDGTNDDSLAIAAATKCTNVYIPKGRYICAIDITDDCAIKISDKATITTLTEHPVFYARNCSLRITGGIFYAGNNDDSRAFVYSGSKRINGMIAMEDCKNCAITAIKSTHSKYGSVVLIKNSTNVVVEESSFANSLYSCVQIIDHCVNVIVRNCRFENLRYFRNDYYCYAVCTGVSTPLLDFSQPTVIPPDRVIYENNYVYESEDCGLDTHGASNVIMRNNVVLETVCALTAYNDTLRVKRPNGWRMHNILIENNRCESTKQNDPATQYPHPFIFLGDANDKLPTETGENGVSYEDNPGIYTGYVNCIVRNNFFKSPSNYQGLIFLTRCIRDVEIANNMLDLCNSPSAPIAGDRMINARIKNNTILNCKKKFIASTFFGSVENNVGLLVGYNEFQHLSYIKQNSYSGFGVIRSMCLWHGEIASNDANKCSVTTSPGLCVRESICPDQFKEVTISVTDGIAMITQNGIKNFLLPNLSLILYNMNNIAMYQAFCTDLIDMSRFTLTRENGVAVPDGEYIAKLKFTTLEEFAYK